MTKQVRIELPASSPQKEKGDFLEDLLRGLMERQRYQVQQRLNFTGAEIDLLCAHKDRKDDTALVECKARQSIVADDVKSFAFNLLVSEKAKHGYFVHTSELQHNVGGLVSELSVRHGQRMTFIGPEKLMDMLVDAGTLVRAEPTSMPGLNLTKTILLFTPETKAWVYIYAVSAARPPSSAGARAEAPCRAWQARRPGQSESPSGGRAG